MNLLWCSWRNCRRGYETHESDSWLAAWRIQSRWGGVAPIFWDTLTLAFCSVVVQLFTFFNAIHNQLPAVLFSLCLKQFWVSLISNSSACLTILSLFYYIYSFFFIALYYIFSYVDESAMNVVNVNKSATRHLCDELWHRYHSSCCL